MIKQAFQVKATKLIQLMIDAIAEKEYTTLVYIIPPNLSWANAEPTPENACLGFGEWLDEQLTMWEEDYNKKYVVDHFNTSCLEKIELKDDNTSFVTYRPTSFEEELNFWFEIDFKVEGEQVTAIFDVNI